MGGRKNGLEFYKKRKKIKSSQIREVISWIFSILVTIFVASVIVYFFGLSAKVIGTSMEPTLDSEQIVLVNRLSYIFGNPKKGQVVLFLPNGNENEHLSVKRVVAVSGDKVKIDNGLLYVNDQVSDFEYKNFLDPGIATTDIELLSGECFVIGDNSSNSEDSRSPAIGPVKYEEIVGKVWFALGNDKSKMHYVGGE